MEYKWYIFHDGSEMAYSEHNTKEEALAEASLYDTSIKILEAKMLPLKLSYWLTFNMDELIYDANEAYMNDVECIDYDICPPFLISEKQLNDLHTKIKRAVDIWQKKNRLVFKGTSFTHTREEIFITQKAKRNDHKRSK